MVVVTNNNITDKLNAEICGHGDTIKTSHVATHRLVKLTGRDKKDMDCKKLSIINTCHSLQSDFLLLLLCYLAKTAKNKTQNYNKRGITFNMYSTFLVTVAEEHFVKHCPSHDGGHLGDIKKKKLLTRMAALVEPLCRPLHC